VLRIFQEALNNVERHSGANRVSIAWTQRSDGIALKITDNGKGIKARDLRHTESLGIIGMRERALLCGGTLAISRNGRSGTSVSAYIPLRMSPPEPK
jgi:signal transduction histidine kinase